VNLLLDGNDLLKAIKRAAVEAVNTTQPSDFCFGTVVSVSPLKISIEQKMTLGSAQLVLTKNVTDYKMSISVDLTSSDALSTHNHQIKDENGNLTNLKSQEVNLSHRHSIKGKNEITIHNALQVDDEVVLLKQKGGQKYLVLDKVVKA
jgi:hypothetical protein